MRLFFVISLLFLSHFSLRAQEKDAARVSLNTVNGQVYIEITVFQGNVCNGMTIYHSTDSAQYEVIGNITGSCGSTTEAIVYNFEHESPSKNSLNYYYVDLNGIGNSNVASIFVIDPGKDDYVLWPNPTNESSILYFQNDFQELIELDVFNLNGELVFNKSTTDSQFLIESSGLENGCYFFSLRKSGEETFARGKFVIHK